MLNNEVENDINSHPPDKSTEETSRLNTPSCFISDVSNESEQENVIKLSYSNERTDSVLPQSTRVTDSNSDEKNYIDALPNEIIIEIFKFLSQFELITVIQLVSKLWRRLSLTPILGSKLFIKSHTPPSICAQFFLTRPLLRILRCTALKCFPSVVQFIGRFDNLECLNIGFCEIDELTAMTLAFNLPTNIRHLNIEGCSNINLSFMKTLVSRCKKIEALNLSHCVNVENESVVEIAAELPLLQRLNLDGIQWITNAALEGLIAGSCLKKGKLRCIWLDGFEITTNGLSDFLTAVVSGHLKILTNLLNVNSIASLKHIPNLDELLSTIGLQILSISFCDNLEDACLISIAGIPSLTELTLRKGRLFTPRALKNLFSLANQSQLTRLRKLDLSDCPSVDDAVIELICECCGPNLHALFLNWCWCLTDFGLMRILDECKNLRHLSLVGNHTIKGESFLVLPVEQPYMRILDLTQCNQVIDSVLTRVAEQMENLYIFDYFGERVLGGMEDVCQYDLLRSINKVPICEH